MIKFQTAIENIGDTRLIIVPREESAKLPSRGQVMVRGTMNDVPFVLPLEPDGKGSHWLKLEQDMLAALKLHEGDVVTIQMESTKDWPEPRVPDDLKNALKQAPEVQPLWEDITPMARWDWLRWINSTKVEATRKHRIEVAFSKLQKGSRRPCCFNRTMCTDPDVSKSGVLLEPAVAK